MRPIKWIALMLALCLLASMMPAALAEEAALGGEIAPAGAVDENTGLAVDDGTAMEAAPEPAPEPEANVEVSEAAAHADRAYYRVAEDGAAVYAGDGEAAEPAALLSANDVVLVTGAMSARAPIAFYAEGSMMSGWMDASQLLPMDEAQTRAYLDAAAAGEVALYQGDLSWPLAALTGVTFDNCLAVLAATALPNDKTYVLNGKEIAATMVGETGAGNCWKWAQSIYKLAWGCSFTENFKGNDSTGLNLLANLSDAQRTLTPAHLRAFLQQTKPGATIRVCACSSECHSFNNDGLSCGHKGHSLIVAEVTSDGVVMMDNATQHTRYYTWQGFCDSWRGYTYVKYIKWPGANPLPANSISADGSTVAVTGVTLSQSSLELTVGQTATLTASVSPGNATISSVSWASSDASVASVADGAITALQAGTATIGVKTVDGGFTATCAVTVKKPVTQKALTKKGDNGTVILGLGEQLQLTPDFATARGWTVAGAKSSKAKVATIGETGLVSALAVGKAKITVVTQNRKKATLTVKVVDPNVPAAVALNRSGTIKLKVGETVQLQAAILPTTATTTYAWASSRSKIATVDANGNVTALKKGSCKIAVRTANGKVAKVKIKVVNK